MTDAKPTTPPSPRVKRCPGAIAALNDAFRASLGPALGRILMTSGVAALPADIRQDIIRGVRSFREFSTDNDAHGEHDFGAFDCRGERIFCTLDYYDPAMEYGANDPADPTKTLRVLTIMLADEY